MNNKPFSFSGRIKSVGYAIQGLITFFKTQHNVWIHLTVAFFVVLAGVFLEVSNNDWCWLIVAITMVLVAEMLNTAIEFLSDMVSPEIHPQIKKVKDVAAGAVLIAVLGAIVIGLVVFLPRVF